MRPTSTWKSPRSRTTRERVDDRASLARRAPIMPAMGVANHPGAPIMGAPGRTIHPLMGRPDGGANTGVMGRGDRRARSDLFGDGAPSFVDQPFAALGCATDPRRAAVRAGHRGRSGIGQFGGNGSPVGDRHQR